MPHARIAAEDYLDALAAHGIDHLFCNPGTDFAPIVEAFARAARTNRKVPRPMVVPHENAALSHGAWLHDGHRQAAGGDAAHQCWHRQRDQHADRREPRPHAGAADLRAARRSPKPAPSGSRNVHIHWAQEMYDQAGMLREMVKWDYEMKRGDQVGDVVDRALELAMTSPQGPVYLSLPREVLGEVVDDAGGKRRARTRAVPRAPVPSPADIEQLGRLDRRARARRW